MSLCHGPDPIRFTEHSEFNENVISEADIIYMTRIQRERFPDPRGIRKSEEFLRVTQRNAREFEA